MKSFLLSVACLLAPAAEVTAAQAIWNVQARSQDIQIDGFIDDWPAVSPLRLAPGADAARVTGEFGGDDLEVFFRALVDREHLYLAVEWIDDVWDLERVRRHEAVWLSPRRQRRNRMLFFDNIRFQIREADYDYILWFSPRADEEGPFTWHRLLEGLRGIETATSTPLITGRSLEDRVTMEIMIPWRELKIEPGKKPSIPLSLLVVDADEPGQALEIKEGKAKSLEWIGRIQLPEKLE